MPEPELIAAYRTTSYRILAGDGSILAEARIDERSATVDSVLAANGAGSGVFITGWNPRSEPTDPAANAAAHDRLERGLRALGVRFLDHVGVGADPSWSEHGLFALDLDLQDALALADALEQHAVVLVRLGEPARLLFTDEERRGASLRAAAVPSRSGSPG
jgi:ribulose-5-phosphate 4-epimerase/fuculose-1-phosphate aldolase